MMNRDGLVAQIVALAETRTRQNLRAVLPHFMGTLKNWRLLVKRLRLIRAHNAGKVPRYKAATEIEGDSSAKAV